MNTTMQNFLQFSEVNWYRENGQWPASRIKQDANGNEFVIGDFSWNRTHPEHEEFIEHKMLKPK